MPLSGYKSVTVPEEAYALAKELVRLGLEENMGKAFANAIKEYVKKREELIKGIQAVKQKWSKDEV
jgi:predicted CopG family antitoxin